MVRFGRFCRFDIKQLVQAGIASWRGLTQVLTVRFWPWAALAVPAGTEDAPKGRVRPVAAGDEWLLWESLTLELSGGAAVRLDDWLDVSAETVTNPLEQPNKHIREKPKYSNWEKHRSHKRAVFDTSGRDYYAIGYLL
jgi:hypothetical protein